MLKQQYESIFSKEQQNTYPTVDAYEQEKGFAISKEKLESMARTLACPLKVNAPNWQHGRIIYSTLRSFLSNVTLTENSVMLDIGTAKGFSACVISHALADAGMKSSVVSIDMMDPNERIARNSVAEIDGLKTIAEFVQEHKNPDIEITFVGGGSTPWLNAALAKKLLIPFAFIDGKHTYDQVALEARSISQMQTTGDVIIFDDCQIEPVGRAVRDVKNYTIGYVNIGPRTYAIAVKK